MLAANQSRSRPFNESRVKYGCRAAGHVHRGMAMQIDTGLELVATLGHRDARLGMHPRRFNSELATKQL